MNLRKDNAVVIGGTDTVGVIISLNKKANEIKLLVADVEQTVAYDAELTKISKSEYDQRLEAIKLEGTVVEVTKELEAVLPEETKVTSAQQARDLFVEMTKSPVIERKHVIRAFREIVGLTDHGAKTYYYNCTTARKAGKL